MKNLARLLLASLILLAPASAIAAQRAQGNGLPHCPAKGPISGEGFVLIGGIDQWLTIDGSRCDKPVVLFLHGGPGNPLSPFSRSLYGSWSKDFTIVQWDQRGAGMTFGRNPGTANTTLTMDRMAADGIEVAEEILPRTPAQHAGAPAVALLLRIEQRSLHDAQVREREVRAADSQHARGCTPEAR